MFLKNAIIIVYTLVFPAFFQIGCDKYVHPVKHEGKSSRNKILKQ